MHGYTAADRPSGTMNTGPSAWNIICKENTGTCIYGIRVEQYREIGGRTSYEEETAPALSYSGRQVAGLIEKLRRLSVTPTGLLEAVDDEVGEWV